MPPRVKIVRLDEHIVQVGPMLDPESRRPMIDFRLVHLAFNERFHHAAVHKLFLLAAKHFVPVQLSAQPHQRVS
ncbi:hypothetical protein D3C84_922940 [compost metagenome]